MAIDKNFVVKNGLEVNNILLHADPVTNKIGIGTDIPEYLLDVREIPLPGIAATLGVSTQTVAFFRGNVTIQGNLDVANDEINVNFADLTTLVGEYVNYNIGTITNFTATIAGIDTLNVKTINAGPGVASFPLIQAGIITVSDNLDIRNTGIYTDAYATIDDLRGEELKYNNAYISTAFINAGFSTRLDVTGNLYAQSGFATDFTVTNTLSITTAYPGSYAIIDDLRGEELDYDYGAIDNLEVGLGTITVALGSTLTYNTGNFDEVITDSVNVGIATINKAKINELEVGIATVTNSLYVNKLYDTGNGTALDVPAYGNQGQYLRSLGPNGVQWYDFGVFKTKQVFIATDGQTEFSGFRYNIQTLNDPPRAGIGTNPVALYLEVFLNGVKLIEGSDYIATNGSGVGVGLTLTSPASLGDVVEVAATFDDDLMLIDGATITVSEKGASPGIASYIDFTDNMFVLGQGSGGITTVGVALSGTYDISVLGISSFTDEVFINPISIANTFYALNLTNLTGGIGTYKQTFVDYDGAPLIYYPLGSKLGIGVTVLEDYNLTVAIDAKIGNIALETNTLTGEAKISPTQSVVSSGTTDRITIGSSLQVENDYFGNGDTLVGIVTQIVPGIGIDVFGTQDLTSGPGKGVVKIDAYRPVGKTIYVSQTGNDDNTGLAENYPKRTIKSAASAALTGDTIKVFPGVYVEENPILLKKTVSVEGTELRNCVVTPKYPNQDLFFVNNGCHLTDLSFIGPQMTDGAAIVSFERLLGVSTGRYFDAARMIRYNLDYIASEAVGFLTSGFSGFAGNHREQDAARTLDLNLDFIAEETVGYLYNDYNGINLSGNPTGFALTTTGVSVDLSKLLPDDTLETYIKRSCKDDIKDVIRSISNDLKAGSNRSSIGAGKSYYSDTGTLLHITGVDGNGNSIKFATRDAINYAVGIATYVIDNLNYASQPGITTYSTFTQDFSYAPIIVGGGCTEVRNKSVSLASTITSILDNYANLAGITTIYGVNIDSRACAKDVRDIWRGICFDITRGGNSKSVASGKAYYDESGNLLPGILKNPEEQAQTIATLEHSFKIARSVVNNVSWGGFPADTTADPINVSFAEYDHTTGITTITTSGPHGLSIDDPTKIVGLAWTCAYVGAGTSQVVFPRESDYGTVYQVRSVVGVNTFTFIGVASTTPHFYTSGGTIQKLKNFQNKFSQIKDLGIQPDPATGFNDSLASCANVVSALHSCIGVVTSIVGNGFAAFSGFSTTYPGNTGYGFTSTVLVDGAEYDNLSGKATISAPGLVVKKGDLIEIRDLSFSCSSGGSPSVQKFPSGKYGYDFNVDKINPDGTFVINVGVSTLEHTYVTGGFVVDRSIGVTTASYDNTTGITTITATGAKILVGDLVTLRDLEFSCPSGAGTTTLYPTGNEGFIFRVDSITGGDADGSDTFTVRVGTSTIPHTYTGNGVIYPPFSKGVGNVLQGPYVRNCTNFIPGSIGMLVDGVNAEPGDDFDVGVTGAMSVDSYTQYNQGGIGVSITNGAYCQLVSIFTICNDIAIFTGTGGQCDITNSNSSFGRLGLVSVGVGDNTSKSIYRYTGKIINNRDGNAPAAEQAEITVSGIGSYRPYDGQALYFGELYYTVQRVEVTEGGSGYIEDNPPTVTFGPPEGENGITAEAIATVENGRVVAIDLVSTGTQYLNPPTITFSGGGGVGAGASATSIMTPIYYTIESATLPQAGISTIILNTNLNNNVSVGTTVYFSRLSLQIASSHSFEWVGAGNEILKAKPGLGGVVIQENEVVKIDGGEIVYTSTDQAGNFKIGDGVTVNQLTGTVTGRAFNQSLLNTVTPLIIALGK
jgi:hypothetical protein